MMRPEKLELEGFGIFKEKQTIDFTQYPDDAIIGVFGINQDGEGGYDSNGSGKSTVLNAISWSLYDRIPIQADKETAIPKESIVNDDSQKAIVTWTFRRDDDLIVFSNSRTANGTQKVSLFINGEEWRGNTNTQKRDKLMSLMGVGGKNKSYFTDFLNVCYFTGEITKSFASKNFSDAKRLEIVSRIRKLEVYDIAIDLVKKDIKTNNDKMATLETKIQSAKEQLDATFDEEFIKKDILRLQNEKAALEDKIKEIEISLANDKLAQELKIDLIKLKNEKEGFLKTLTDLRDKSYKDYSQILRYRADKLKLEDELKGLPEPIDFTQMESALKIYEEEVLKEVVAKKDFIRIYDEKEAELRKLADEDYLECPVCNSSLAFKDHILHKVDIELIETIKKNIQIDITELVKSKERAEENITRLDTKKLETKRILEAARNALYKREQNERSIEFYKKEMDKLFDAHWMFEEGGILKFQEEFANPNLYEEYQELVSKINIIENQLKNLVLSQYTSNDITYASNQINNINLNVDRLQNKVADQKIVRDKLAALENELMSFRELREKYDYWVLGYKKLKNVELLETAPTLEAHTNRILSAMGTGMEVAYKIDEEANGLSITLTEDSGQIRPLELFSTGQSNRIGFAAGLALKSLNQDSNLDFGFTLWDEVLDGLDNTGQDKFFDILRDLAGLKLVISHDINLKQFFEHKITVVRKNHKSNIYLE